MRPVLLAATVLAACAARPVKTTDDPKEARLDEQCRVTRCRPATRVRIPLGDQGVYEVDFPPSPWVVDQSAISLVPGETLHIEADVGKDGLLEHLRAVETIVAPERTIQLTFTSPADPFLAQLEVKNPFDRPLRYKLGMQLAGRDGLFATSSVPVGAKISAVELWNDPIVQLVLIELRLGDPP
jgi:hypothetical protein